MLTVRKAEQADARDLAPRLRDIDVRECRELFGIEPEAALLAGVTSPDATSFAVVREDGVVAALFGVVPHEGVGIVWLLSSNDFERLEYAKQLRREFPGWIARLQGDLPLIHNVIYRTNQSTIRLLQSAGFIFLPADPFGACLEIVRITPCVHQP